MQKIKIVRRGFNSRRYFRKLNSVTELVGKEVEVADNQDTVQAEIEEVSVTNDEVTLTLDNGDDVILDSNEVENLLETGEAISEDGSTPDEPELDEFSVTREVLDADGNVNEVTTVVESEDEDSAIETVTLLDSRRGRNSRNYVVRKSNSRRRNSRKFNSGSEYWIVSMPEDGVGEPEWAGPYNSIKDAESDMSSYGIKSEYPGNGRDSGSYIKIMNTEELKSVVGYIEPGSTLYSYASSAGDLANALNLIYNSRKRNSDVNDLVEKYTEILTESNFMDVFSDLADELGERFRFNGPIEATRDIKKFMEWAEGSTGISDKLYELIDRMAFEKFSNSRKSSSRKRNSSSIPTFTIVIEGEGEYEITDAYVDGSYVGAESFGDITVDPTLAKQIELGNVAELHWNSLSDYEDGVAPNVTYLNCDTKRNSIYRVSRKVNGCVRKASVMACNSEDAVEAVKESDGDATVESEYSVEEGESTDSPVIISDEEVVETPAEGEGTEPSTDGEGTDGSEPESEEKLEEPASQSDSTEVKVDETPGESTEVTVSDEPAEASIEEADRESNSFKGVAEFVNRKYGVKL